MGSTEDWQKKADEDFETAEFNKNNEKYEYAAFLYQQAVEKSLKALMIKNEQGLLKTHDCFILAKKVDAPKNIINKSDSISPYYFRTRYPDIEKIEITKQDIEEIHESALEVIEWTRNQF